jgi:hypothetical protein
MAQRGGRAGRRREQESALIVAEAQPKLLVHVVGSVPLDGAEDVFGALAGTLGPYLKRLPDGETGPRKLWIGMISDMLDKHPALEVDPDVQPFEMKLWTGEVHRTLKRLRFRAGIDPKAVKFETGYGAMAIASYAIFDRLQQSGVIPAEIKFQIAIPSPFAPTYNYISKRHRAAFLDVFTAHLCDEVAKIAKALPNDRIAIQWDILQEILAWENYFTDRDADYMDQIRSTLGRIGNAVPQPIELGYHLCYGSPKDQHLVQPKDTAIMAELIRETFKAVNRPIEFFHMPVPKERSDAAFFKPLAELALPADTELHLGLVHLNDDAGNKARLATAQQFAKVTGISTECGWGRGDPERVRALLEAHRLLVA